MRRWLWLLKEIINDELGGSMDWMIWPISEEDTEGKYERYDPYKQQRDKFINYLTGKLGNPTPYKYNPEFELPQPEVEKAAENTILGRLGNLPKTGDYSQKIEAAKSQQIAREKERSEEQLGQEREMYNRLGLVSSTPFMSRAGELGDESLMRQNDIESSMDMYGMEYGLRSDELYDRIAQGWTGLGTALGGMQRGYSQYAQQMSMADIERMFNEEMGYGGLLNSALGQPLDYYDPSLVEQLASFISGIFGGSGQGLTATSA